MIDDPVSSLDANSLFNAFSFMKERTNTCGQLFILTHNFSFFRQVKNWTSYMKKPRASCFSLNATVDENGRRCATLDPLDLLLQEFESEYHYLFRRVQLAAKQANVRPDLATLYGLPNIGRRVLEAFLAFKQPDKTGKLYQQLQAIDFDSKKKTRIFRFLHTFSHKEFVSEGSHEPHILAEGPKVMQDLLDFIKAVDEEHYLSMERLLQK